MARQPRTNELVGKERECRENFPAILQTAGEQRAIGIGEVDMPGRWLHHKRTDPGGECPQLFPLHIEQLPDGTFDDDPTAALQDMSRDIPLA